MEGIQNMRFTHNLVVNGDCTNMVVCGGRELGALLRGLMVWHFVDDIFFFSFSPIHRNPISWNCLLSTGYCMQIKFHYLRYT